MEILYQITLSYACASIIVKNNIVIKTAPIFNWMIGKNLMEIRYWVDKKMGSITKVKNKNGTKDK